MTPIPNRMAVNPSINPLVFRLLQRILQYLIASLANYHIRLYDILQPIYLLQAIFKTFWNILLGFAWLQNI